MAELSGEVAPKETSGHAVSPKPDAEATVEDLANLQENVVSEVRSILTDLSGFLVQWPALAIIATGIVLAVIALFSEIWRPRLSATEYVGTLVSAAVLCIAGGVLEAVRFRRL